jgi:hypothetical protein
VEKARAIGPGKRGANGGGGREERLPHGESGEQIVFREKEERVLARALEGDARLLEEGGKRFPFFRVKVGGFPDRRGNNGGARRLVFRSDATDADGVSS